STWWQSAPYVESTVGTRFARGAWTIAGITYVLLVLGAVLRHVPLSAPPALFRAALVLHLVVAAALAVHVSWMAWRIRQLPRTASGLRVTGFTIPTLVLIQLLLGFPTYAAKYAFP